MLSFLLPQLLESVVETLLFGNIIYWRVFVVPRLCSGLGPAFVRGLCRTKSGRLDGGLGYPGFLASCKLSLHVQQRVEMLATRLASKGLTIWTNILGTRGGCSSPSCAVWCMQGMQLCAGGGPLLHFPAYHLDLVQL